MRDPDEGLAREAMTERWQRLGDELAHLVALVGLARSARLIAVALVPVLFALEDLGRTVPLYTALIGYVLVTSFVPRNRFLRAADLAVAATLVVATGGATLTFFPFLVVAVAGTAAHGGMVAGLAGGGMLATVLAVMLLATGQLGTLAGTQLVPIGLLLPLLGVTVGAAAQVHAHEQARDRRALQEANRLLSALRELTDDLPGGLDATTVSAALVAEVRQLPGAPTTVVYALRDGILQPIATHGVSRGSAPSLRIDQLRRLAAPGRAALRTLASLPDELQRACRDHRWWVTIGMYREDELIGGLLVGVDEPDDARQARPRLLALADDGAVALQNAQLFDGTRERAVQAARTHLAGDLHDGAAQALAHLRMELELLSRDATDEEREELLRLSSVARSALEDLRATISGLRATGSSDIDEAIRRHIAHLTKVHGPRIEFSHTGSAQLDATSTDEVLRVLQEALSNALRHARAEHVWVRLERDARVLLLTIEDDGVGLDVASDDVGGGVGLASMRERAERLGGELVVRPGRVAGTVVELEVPVAPPRASRIALPPAPEDAAPRGRRRASPTAGTPPHRPPDDLDGTSSRQAPVRPASGT